MSAAFDVRPPTTLDEFLAWERLQNVRHEWTGTQPHAMVGSGFRHNRIATRLFGLLDGALRGTPCTAALTELRVMTARRSRVRYPDIVVTGSPVLPDALEIEDPVVIVQVLSDSTAGIDRGIKRAEYAELPSLRRYVMLSQDEPLAAVCDREGGFAERMVRDVLEFPEFRLSVPLADLHAGLTRG